MTENEILLLHDRLYEYLKGLHMANPNFMFSFTKDNERLKKKLWFDETVSNRVIECLSGNSK
jgi:hypothetical protein